jgi:hypothetical protein
LTQETSEYYEGKLAILLYPRTIFSNLGVIKSKIQNYFSSEVEI